jgi:putative Holliday junction resolvase
MLGVDYGARRIGLAVSEGSLAVPLCIIAHESRDADLERVASAARERRVAAVVVGLPLLPSGDEGEQARRTRRFGDALARRLDVPVIYHDEIMSSAAAEEATRITAARRGRHIRIDDQAAAIILQSYIDERMRGQAE